MNGTELISPDDRDEHIKREFALQEEKMVTLSLCITPCYASDMAIVVHIYKFSLTTVISCHAESTPTNHFHIKCDFSLQLL